MFKKNIPNMITISRIITSIIAPIMFIMGNIPLALGLYGYGAISDFLDGFMARKLKAFTELGRKLDPISDKIYALSLIAPSLVMGNIFMLIPLLLEGEIVATTVAARKSRIKMETEMVGKYKTWGLFGSAILSLMATQVPSLFIPSLVLVGFTGKMQVESIKAYNKQYKDKLRGVYSNNSIISEKGKSIKEKVYQHYGEVNYYLDKPLLKKSSKDKVRVKKKNLYR